MKNLKKIARENLKEIMGGANINSRCCAYDACGNCVYWVANGQICPRVIIPAC